MKSTKEKLKSTLITVGIKLVVLITAVAIFSSWVNPYIIELKNKAALAQFTEDTNKYMVWVGAYEKYSTIVYILALALLLIGDFRRIYKYLNEEK